MPLLFKTEVKQSPIAGRGLFTLQFIPKGAVVWAWECQNGGIPTKNFEAKEHRFYTKEDVQAITDEKQLLELLMYVFYDRDNDVLCLIGDAGRHTNHSWDNYNLDSTTPVRDNKKAHVSIAARDIHPGQQILQNYGQYPSYECPWLWQLMQKHKKDRYDLQSSIRQLQSTQ